MSQRALARLRLIGWLEGCSFVVLLGVAMPLKYLADAPLAVRYVGWAHGALFLAMCAALVHTSRVRAWPLEKSVGVLIAALLPFGPFVLDRSLKRELAALKADS